MRILGALAAGPLSSGDVVLLFVPLLLTLVTFVLGTVKIPALTNAIFSGRAGDYVTVSWR
jgi:acyl-coenzyme A synthetase/AMP-(fatty) acid ligase